MTLTTNIDNAENSIGLLLGGCPFNGPLSGMKIPYPYKVHDMTMRPLLDLNITIKSTIVVRSRSRSCGGGDICGTTPA